MTPRRARWWSQGESNSRPGDADAVYSRCTMTPKTVEMVDTTGIEPASPGLQGPVAPLVHACPKMVGREGLEPTVTALSRRGPSR